MLIESLFEELGSVAPQAARQHNSVSLRGVFNMISFAQAQDNLHQLCRTWLVTHPDVSEPLALSESLGRYLTEDVIAALELPRSDVSAMDGYAVCSQDLEGALTSQVFTLRESHGRENPTVAIR